MKVFERFPAESRHRSLVDQLALGLPCQRKTTPLAVLWLTCAIQVVTILIVTGIMLLVDMSNSLRLSMAALAVIAAFAQDIAAWYYRGKGPRRG